MDKYLDRLVPSSYILLEPVPVSDVCENGFVEYFYPKNDLKTRVLEFEVEGNSDHLMVPSAAYLRLKLELVCTRKKVEQKAGDDGQLSTVTKEPDFKKVSVVNNLFSSLFESVEVLVGNTELSKNERNNQYVSYLLTLLNFGSEQFDTYFKLLGWSKDTAEAMDTLSRENDGWQQRQDMFRKGTRTVELIGKIGSPIFFHPKVLLTQLGMRVILRVGSPEFYMMYPEGEEHFDIVIKEAVLMVQKLAVVKGVRQGYNEILQRGDAIPYFLKTPYVTHYAIDRHSSQFVKENLFQGKIPNKVILGMVLTEAYHGKTDRNPFNFQHFGLTDVCMYMNGAPYPRPAIKLDAEEGKIAEAYHYFMTSINAAYSRVVPDITMEDYQNGYFLISYNMAPDQFIGSAHPANLLKAHSNIRLEMKFKKPLKENVTLLVYYEYTHVAEVTKPRQVHVEF